MNDLTNENISHIMDNEWDEATETGSVDELVRAVTGSDETAQKWARYHLIRDVMQNEYTPVLGSDFASKVSSAIDAEPAIVAFPASARGAASAAQESGSAATSINKARPSSDSRSAPGWKRTATGFAIAASVAVVSVVGLNLWSGEDTQTPSNVAQAPQVPGLTVGAQNLELVANRGTYWVDKSRNSLSPKNQEKLNMFLSRHIENAPTAHSGMFPYSRLVGYDRVVVKPANGQASGQ